MLRKVSWGGGGGEGRGYEYIKEDKADGLLKLVRDRTKNCSLFFVLCSAAGPESKLFPKIEKNLLSIKRNKPT